MLRSVQALLLSSVVLLHAVPAGAQSITLKDPLVYGEASLDALQAHQKTIAAETAAMQARLDNGLTYRDVIDDDFRQEIFDVDANDVLQDHLQKRLATLNAESQQDSAPLEQVKKKLASTMIQWSNCQGPENCEALKTAMEALKGEQDQLKELAAARMTVTCVRR